MKMHRILAINPGSTSTKVAVYEGEKLLKELILRHTTDELKDFERMVDQFGFRKNIVIEALAEAGIDIGSLDAVIGRGGLVKPIASGIYEVNEAMKDDLQTGRYGEHASNLGGLIAADIARMAGVKAYIADPVVVNELQDVARISGLPELEKVPIFHALNQKAIARLYAKQHGRSYEELNLIVAHLGGGISVGAHREGKVVDVNNCLDGEGPISPERAGTLPAGALVKLCFSGKYTQSQILKMITGRGGLVAHLGTNDTREAMRRAQGDSNKARIVMDAMCYTIGKSIGAAAAVLHGKVDAIILTGGIAHNQDICSYIEKMVSFISPVTVMAGENELEALAFNVLRVLEGAETPKEYV